MNNFMQIAIDISGKVSGEIPVGAVIVKNDTVIAAASNRKEKNNDVTSHAEILAIKNAEKALNNWRLDECDMYVTLEPCPMCGWAILQSRIKNLYFGTYDKKYGAFTCANLQNISEFKTNVYGGIMENECDKILDKFFKTLRAEN